MTSMCRLVTMQISYSPAISVEYIDIEIQYMNMNRNTKKIDRFVFGHVINENLSIQTLPLISYFTKYK